MKHHSYSILLFCFSALLFGLSHGLLSILALVLLGPGYPKLFLVVRVSEGPA